MSNQISKRDRVIRSINRDSVDLIPWQLDLTRVIENRLKEYYGADDLWTATGDHIIWLKPQIPPALVDPNLAPGLAKTEFGDIWEMNDETGNWGKLVFSPIREPSLQGYVFPDISLPGRWNHLGEIRNKYPDHFLVAHSTAIFERAWAMCGGFERYFMYLASEEKFVEELTKKLTDYMCGLIAQLDGLGVDGFRFGDDWGFQNNLMICPQAWRRIYKKYYQRIIEAGKKIGLVMMMHSCGNVTAILPDLIEIGLDVYHPFQPEAMNVEFCKKEFGKDIAFWGGLGTQSTLPFGMVDDVRQEVKDRLELFADGGYILAPAGAISHDAPIENVIAMIDAAKEQLGKDNV